MSVLEQAAKSSQRMCGRRVRSLRSALLVALAASPPADGRGLHHPAAPQTIDPALRWNTFLGGAVDEFGNAIAVDAQGSLYVVGDSKGSWGDPVRAFTPGKYDCFVAKLDGSGALVWNTFLGGTGDDGCRAVAVDGNGEIHVVGQANAAWGSPVRAYSGPGVDAFAARLDASGGRTSGWLPAERLPAERRWEEIAWRPIARGGGAARRGRRCCKPARLDSV